MRMLHCSRYRAQRDCSDELWAPLSLCVCLGSAQVGGGGHFFSSLFAISDARSEPTSPSQSPRSCSNSFFKKKK